MNDFSEDLREYMKFLEHERRAAAWTLHTYKNHLNIFGRFLCSGIMVDYRHPTDREVDAVLGLAGKRWQSRASLSSFCSVLRGFYRWLAASERVPPDAIKFMELMESPPVVSRLQPALSEEQIRALIAVVSPFDRLGARNKAILEVFYSTGCRARELCGLLLADLDLSRAVIVCRGKGGKERLLHLGEPAALAVQSYIHFGRTPLYGPKVDSPFLFLPQGGPRISYQAVRSLIMRCAKAAGLPAWVRPHTLRRSCALHLLQGSKNVRAVQEFLGHASLNSTQRYINIHDDQLQRTHATCHPLGADSAEPAIVASEPASEPLPPDWRFSD